MKDKTREQLLNINSLFYEKYADDFSATRQYFWKGWELAWEIIKKNNHPITRVLDVGCGNGRFLEFLRKKTDNFSYLGIDHSPVFISKCQTNLADNNSFFMRFDIVNDDFSKIAIESYDLISVIAVLHHIPGFDYRKKLIKQLASVLNTNGLLMLTFWEFMNESSIADRIFPWSLSGIDRRDLEEGDYLLKWSDSPKAQRYCHFFSESEKSELVNFSGLDCIAEYTADGRNDRLNTYMILQKY